MTQAEFEKANKLFQSILDPLQEKIIQEIVENVRKVGKLTDRAAYLTWRAQALGLSQRRIMQEIQRQLGKTKVQIYDIFDTQAYKDYRKIFIRFGYDAIPLAMNKGMQEIVSGMAQLAEESLTGIVQSMGCIGPGGQFLAWQQFYQSTTDRVFEQVVMGTTDYNTAIRDACEQFASAGLYTIDYESGQRWTIEAATRRNIMSGLGLLLEKTQQKAHDELGANGWEISAHYASAPDHEPIQGKQYSDADFEKLNNSLKRRIGTLHCGHVASPIIIGMMSPAYDAGQLEDMRKKNSDGVTIDGQHYTQYEAKQKARALERVVRKKKRVYIAARASGNKVWEQEAQSAVGQAQTNLIKWNRQAHLTTQMERTYTPGED